MGINHVTCPSQSYWSNNGVNYEGEPSFGSLAEEKEFARRCEAKCKNLPEFGPHFGYADYDEADYEEEEILNKKLADYFEHHPQPVTGTQIAIGAACGIGFGIAACFLPAVTATVGILGGLFAGTAAFMAAREYARRHPDHGSEEH